MIKLYLGECLNIIKTLPDNSVDSIVTDPPYGLSKQPDMAEVMRHWLNGDDYTHKGGGFMGKAWDSFVPGPSVWRECLRILKPGGHLVAFAGSRTYDLMALSVRLAGFEIRDQLMWLYGSGFPKSLDVSKAVDKQAGKYRKSDHKPNNKNNTFGSGMGGGKHGAISEPPITEAAKQWQGFGTALKPAHEPIVLARKPLDGTVAANLLKYGAGALNIDGCRVGRADSDRTEYGVDGDEPSAASEGQITGKRDRVAYTPHEQGRFPSNIMHDGSEPIAGALGQLQGAGIRAGIWVHRWHRERSPAARRLPGRITD